MATVDGEGRFWITNCKGKPSEDGTADALYSLVLQPGVATRLHLRIVRLLENMKKIGLILCAGFCLFIAPARLTAQSDDPSEVFLKAYMTSQQGEKLEQNNQLQAALAKFRFAGSLLEELRKSHADWQPAIVDYRSRKIGENILRVQNRLSTQRIWPRLRSRRRPPPPLRRSSRKMRDRPSPVSIWAERKPERREFRCRGANHARRSRTMPRSRKRRKKLREKVDQLQAELQKSRSQYTTVEKEKESLSNRLKETDSKLEKAQSELEKTKGAETEVRGRLAQAESSLKKIESTAGANTKAQEALRAEVAQLKKALASAEEGRSAAEKEKDTANTKLTDANTQVAAVAKERDQLLKELKSAKQAQDRVQILVAENSELKEKLAGAEKLFARSAKTNRRRNRKLPR